MIRHMPCRPRRCFILELGGLVCLASLAVAAPTNTTHRLVSGEIRTPMTVQAENYVKRSRAVILNSTLLAPGTAVKPGDVILIEVMSNLTYAVTVQRLTLDRFGSVSLIGSLPGSTLGTVTLTANKGMVIGTLQDLATKAYFSIRCTGPARTQMILEMDTENQPARIDLPARIPPPEPGPRIKR